MPRTPRWFRANALKAVSEADRAAHGRHDAKRRENCSKDDLSPEATFALSGRRKRSALERVVRRENCLAWPHIHSIRRPR